MLLFSENCLWRSTNGSLVNLLRITVARYLNVVLRGFSEKFLHISVMYCAAAFAWISCIAYQMAVEFLTTAEIDGVCNGYVIWKSRVAAARYAYASCPSNDLQYMEGDVNSLTVR